MLRGSMVALVTPMKADNSLDWESLEKLVDWHLEQGTHGIVMVGTTGESATLNIPEHVQVIRRVVDQVAGRIPVVAGTGANSTSEALELTEGARQAKADACLSVTPYYNKPTQEGLYQHYEYLAKHVSIPQLLYNVPGRTAVDLLPETVARLSKLDNIIGIKDATASMERLQALKEQSPNDFLFLSGDDETALKFMELGGHGEISVTANVAPALSAKMCDYVLAGDFQQAAEIDQRLLPLHQALFVESNPIPVKWAVAQLGLIGPYMRLPMTPLSAEYHEQVRSAMVGAGVLDS